MINEAEMTLLRNSEKELLFNLIYCYSPSRAHAGKPITGSRDESGAEEAHLGACKEDGSDLMGWDEMGRDGMGSDRIGGRRHETFLYVCEGMMIASLSPVISGLPYAIQV